MDLGNNKAMCVFNKTIYTNATIMDKELVYCDSPPFENSQGYTLMNSDNPQSNFYIIEVTIDGGKEMTNAGLIFGYYIQPEINSISPVNGPLEGGT